MAEGEEEAAAAQAPQGRDPARPGHQGADWVGLQEAQLEQQGPPVPFEDTTRGPIGMAEVRLRTERGASLR